LPGIPGSAVVIVAGGSEALQGLAAETRKSPLSWLGGCSKIGLEECSGNVNVCSISLHSGRKRNFVVQVHSWIESKRILHNAKYDGKVQFCTESFNRGTPLKILDVRNLKYLLHGAVFAAA
jgi:hypothetical protein